MVDYSERIEKVVSPLIHVRTREVVVYISGFSITAGGRVYSIYKAIGQGKNVILRGVDGAKVEEFSTRSQPAQALERYFQQELAKGNVEADLMDREMTDEGLRS